MIAYTEQDWHSVIVHMESCLDEYFKEHERCLADCEGSVGVEGVEFTPGVAGIYITYKYHGIISLILVQNLYCMVVINEE